MPNPEGFGWLGDGFEGVRPDACVADVAEEHEGDEGDCDKPDESRELDGPEPEKDDHEFDHEDEQGSPGDHDDAPEAGKDRKVEESAMAGVEVEHPVANREGKQKGAHQAMQGGDPVLKVCPAIAADHPEKWKTSADNGLEDGRDSPKNGA